jgi:hypothetical protein
VGHGLMAVVKRRDPAELDVLTSAEQALAACRTVEEAIKGVAVAEAARYAASRVKAGTRLENYATGIKVKYELRLAALVDEGQASGHILTKGQRAADVRGANNTVVTLAELGVDAPRLLEARQIAAVYSASDIDAIIDEANAEDRAVSRRSLIIAANRARASTSGTEALPEPKKDPTAAERQRRHRLLERMRPQEPLPKYVEPLEVAADLLTAIDTLAELMVATAGTHATLGNIREQIKRIAWWPRQ